MRSAMHSLVNRVAAACNRQEGLAAMVGVARIMYGLDWGLCLLLGANGVAFAAMCLQGGWPYALGYGETGGLQDWYDRYGVQPRAWWIAGRPVFPGALTGMFVHTGGWHWAGNCFWLLVFGRRQGAWAVGVYLAGGTAANVLHAALHPYGMVALVGASAAVTALLGLRLVSGSVSSLGLGRGGWRIPGQLLLGVFAGLMVASAFLPEPQLNALALHLAGHAVGVVAGLIRRGIAGGAAA